MAYRIAGIDVHKKMLAVVVADVEGESEYQFERRQFGTTPDHLRLLSEWFVEQEVEEVVMESTAQYWKPVWGALYLRDGVSPPRTTPGTQSDHWGNCPSALSADLDNLAPRGPLRGTRPSRVRKVEANTHCENDPAAPTPRLPRRTADCSTQPSMRPGAGDGIFDPARHSETIPK